MFVFKILSYCKNRCASIPINFLTTSSQFKYGTFKCTLIKLNLGNQWTAQSTSTVRCQTEQANLMLPRGLSIAHVVNQLGTTVRLDSFFGLYLEKNVPRVLDTGPSPDVVEGLCHNKRY